MKVYKRLRFVPQSGFNLPACLLVGTIQYEYSNPTFPHLRGLDLIGVRWITGHTYQVVSKGQKTVKTIPAGKRIDRWLMARYSDQWQLKEMPVQDAVHRLFVILPKNLFITNK